MYSFYGGIMKYSIGFDLDGVVCDIYHDAFPILKEMYPKKVTKDVFGNNWEQEFHLTEQEVMNCFIACGSKGLLRTAKIYPGAKETLYKLVRKYNVYFISWRNYIPNSREDTLYWLDSNKIPYEKLVLTNNKHKIAVKEDLCFYCDDNTAQCNRIAKTKVPTFLFTRPWNEQDDTDAMVKRTSGWKDIEKTLNF
jgi:5'(3')-deoxyribonucleotidase